MSQLYSLWPQPRPLVMVSLMYIVSSAAMSICFLWLQVVCCIVLAFCMYCFYIWICCMKILYSGLPRKCFFPCLNKGLNKPETSTWEQLSSCEGVKPLDIYKQMLGHFPAVLVATVLTERNLKFRHIWTGHLKPQLTKSRGRASKCWTVSVWQWRRTHSHPDPVRTLPFWTSPPPAKQTQKNHDSKQKKWNCVLLYSADKMFQFCWQSRHIHPKNRIYL